jgi:hypothetical protein
MQVTHKRLILELSAAFHHEKYNNFNLADLNNAMPSGWNYNLKLPVDSRAVEIADIIMKIYRYAFIGLMHNNEKYRYKRMSIPVRNDNIKTMLRNGISTKKLSDLFSLPETRIFEQLPNDFDKTDGRQKHSDKQKAVAVNLANEQPNLKKQITEMLGLTIRTLDRWIKDDKEKNIK